MINMVTEEELVARAKSGDKDSFRALCEKAYPYVYKYVYESCKRNKALTIELTAQTFVRLSEKINNFRGEAKFSTWAVAFARNILREHYRNQKQRAKTELTLSWDKVNRGKLEAILAQHRETVAEEEEIKDKEYQIVRDSLELLTDEQKEVVILRFFKGLSIKDVAAITDKTPAAIKCLQTRAFRIIKDHVLKQ